MESSRQVTFKSLVYNARHGGPFDRGSADSYYGRIKDPHYYVGDTGFTHRVDQARMTTTELAEYDAGYEWNEEMDNKKEW